MKTNLLYSDFEQEKMQPYSMKDDMIKDLNLDLVFREMSKGDEELLKIVKSIVLTPLNRSKDIVYRQDVLKDVFKNRDDIESFYEEIVRTMKLIEQYRERTKRQRKSSGTLSQTVEIYANLEILIILLNGLFNLKSRISKASGRFQSQGMRTFLEEVEKTYDIEMIEEIKKDVDNMTYLTQGGSIRMTVGISDGMKCGNAVVNDILPEEPKRNAFIRMVRYIYLHLFCKDIIWLKDSARIYQAREIENAGLLHVLTMYQGFIKELTDFFETLKTQFGFYIGGANLIASMKNLALPYSFPFESPQKQQFRAKGLYDLGLALHTHELPVANDIDFEQMKLLIISGANQGGKSTYLRSLGLSQVLFQSGLIVPATDYRNRLYDNILTHFSRREDQAMNRGRLEEELKRMDRIVKSIRNDSLVLLNESFASTTEQDGSTLADGIVRAFFDKGIHTFMVTHLYQFVNETYHEKKPGMVFLSAGRMEDGSRTYIMEEKEPSETSYGIDLYDAIMQ